MCRHKVLDCLGDFALLGCDIEGQFAAYRSGHHLNRTIIAKLAHAVPSMRKLVVPLEETPGGSQGSSKMPVKISHLSQVDPRAELGENVDIGPFCCVGPDVFLGNGCQLVSHVTITGHTTIGERNRFFPGAVIGAEPQDLSYDGAPTRVEIGHENVFREGVTVSRGAEKEDHTTRIGHQNMLMANSHVAHNCHVQNRVILVNGVLLGGHVHVHDGAIISGNCVVHHFSTVGMLAFVSGGSARSRTTCPRSCWYPAPITRA